MLIPKRKAAIFIDGSNVYATAKKLGFDIDYSKLLVHYGKKYDIVRAFYYTAIMEDDAYSSIRPLIDYLAYNGFSMVTKPAKEYQDEMTGRRKIKGNMDIELCVDALLLAKHIDFMILFSGDGDFAYLVKAVQAQGVRVETISSIETTPSFIADELRRATDIFTDLAELRESIMRVHQPSHRNAVLR